MSEANAAHQPVACSLTQADQSARQERWLRLAERAYVHRQITDNGLQLAFRAAPDVERELRQLAVLERDCCAFADWTVRADRTALQLDISADSDEGIAAVQALFADLRLDSSRR